MACKGKLHLYYETCILPTDVEAPLFVKQSNVKNKQVVHNAMPVKKKKVTYPSEEHYKNFMALVNDSELHVDDYRVLCESHRKHGSLIHLQ